MISKQKIGASAVTPPEDKSSTTNKPTGSTTLKTTKGQEFGSCRPLKPEPVPCDKPSRTRKCLISEAYELRAVNIFLISKLARQCFFNIDYLITCGIELGTFNHYDSYTRV